VSPGSTRPRTLAPIAALSAVALAALAACADAPSAPRAAMLEPGAAPARALSSTLKSQTLRGDTVVTVFVVGTNTSNGTAFSIGHTSKIDFPYSSGSICAAGSSYGPSEWDRPCAPTQTTTEITARVWKDAQGFVQTDFQPAMRFVPGLRKGVVLTLKDAAAAANHRIDFCTSTGCVNEAASDPSLATVIDANNGFATRVIKHFSGYNVVVDRAGDGGDEGGASFDGY
jgi:hypothetical protein